MAILLLLQNPEVGASTLGVYYSVSVLVMSGVLGSIWIYMQKQFSALTKRHESSEKVAAEFRTDVLSRFSGLTERINGIPANIALQAAENYEKGARASREAFVAKDACGQRQKDVDRRLDGIESVARKAAHDADESGFRIRGLENGSGD